MFGLSKPLLYGMAALVLAAIIIAAGAAIRADLKAVGQHEILETVKRGNDDAGNAAEESRAALRRCLDAGGVYVFETGTCEP